MAWKERPMSRFEDEVLRSKRNENKPETMEDGYTIGQLISAVLRMKTALEIGEFGAGYRAHLEALPIEKCAAGVDDIVQQNIGFCFGQGMAPEQVRMWQEGVGAFHPFGLDVKTPDEVLEAGMKFGAEMRGQQE